LGLGLSLLGGALHESGPPEALPVAVALAVIAARSERVRRSSEALLVAEEDFVRAKRARTERPAGPGRGLGGHPPRARYRRAGIEHLFESDQLLIQVCGVRLVEFEELERTVCPRMATAVDVSARGRLVECLAFLRFAAVPSVMLGVSRATSYRYLHDTLPVLADVVSTHVRPSDRDPPRPWLPTGLVGAIDTFFVTVQPTHKTQPLFYNSHYGGAGVKFGIVVTLSGRILEVSEAFSSRTADIKIARDMSFLCDGARGLQVGEWIVGDMGFQGLQDLGVGCVGHARS
jgi:hypothetical protein